MSMRTKIAKMDSKTRKKIVALMYQNGVDYETVGYMLKNGTLSDVADYVDIEELMEV